MALLTNDSRPLSHDFDLTNRQLDSCNYEAIMVSRFLLLTAIFPLFSSKTVEMKKIHSAIPYFGYGVCGVARYDLIARPDLFPFLRPENSREAAMKYIKKRNKNQGLLQPRRDELARDCFGAHRYGTVSVLNIE